MQNFTHGIHAVGTVRVCIWVCCIATNCPRYVTGSCVFLVEVDGNPKGPAGWRWSISLVSLTLLLLLGWRSASAHRASVVCKSNRMPGQAFTNHVIGQVFPVRGLQPADLPTVLVSLVALSDRAWYRNLAQLVSSNSPVGLSGFWCINTCESDDKRTSLGVADTS